jgi:hypothetical protein
MKSRIFSWAIAYARHDGGKSPHHRPHHDRLIMTFVQEYRERTAAANQARQQGTCRKLERIEATLRTMRRDGTRWRSVERAQSPPRYAKSTEGAYP